MNTLSKSVQIQGIGIHSGRAVTMTVAPDPNKRGISFCLGNQRVVMSPQAMGTSNIRSTTLTHGGITIQTPEHFLSACYALSLTHIIVTLTHYELPILDGSAIEFIRALQPVLVPLTAERPRGCISLDTHFEHNESHYMAMPSEVFKIDAYVSYPQHWLKTVGYSYVHSESRYIDDIASARTYGFTHELEALRNQGLAKGGSLDNALVVSDTGYLNEPRYTDEVTRHKILDFIGDMAIYGREWVGHFVIIKPSHEGNLAFLNHIIQDALLDGGR
jgi:UDP-3-O-[3-hydroxymyristoyl] N-acetylglucosamine deacetylase